MRESEIKGGGRMEMVQVAVLGVAGTLLAVQFKNEKPEYGIYISLAIGIL